MEGLRIATIPASESILVLIVWGEAGIRLASSCETCSSEPLIVTAFPEKSALKSPCKQCNLLDQ